MSSWDYPPQQKKDFPNTHQTNTNFFSAQQLQLLWYPSIGVLNGTDLLVLLLWICRIRKRIAPNLCHNENAKRIQQITLSCILLFMGRRRGGTNMVCKLRSDRRLRRQGCRIRSFFKGSLETHSECFLILQLSLQLCHLRRRTPHPQKKTSKLRDHHGLITVDCSGLGK